MTDAIEISTVVPYNIIERDEKMKKAIALAIAFVLLNALDIGLTLAIVGNGGGAELNPVMEFILRQPLPIILLFKLGGSAFFATALILLARRFEKSMARVLRLVVTAMVLICVFNLMGVPLG